jgi:hypothetical protein
MGIASLRKEGMIEVGTLDALIAIGMPSEGNAMLAVHTIQVRQARLGLHITQCEQCTQLGMIPINGAMLVVHAMQDEHDIMPDLHCRYYKL